MILCDTAPIVAALDDDDHITNAWSCSRDAPGPPAVVPATVVAEVGYLLAREAGARVGSMFPTAPADGDFLPVDLIAEDYRRAAELVQTYSDLPLGTTDATVIAPAERLGLTEVATLDRRHFTVLRPQQVSALTPLP